MRCVITCVHAAALVGLEEDDASRPLRWLFVSIFSIERLRLLGGGLSRLKSTFFYRLLQKKCRYIRRSRHTANRRDKNISLFQKKKSKSPPPFFFLSVDETKLRSGRHQKNTPLLLHLYKIIRKRVFKKYNNNELK